MQSHDVPMPSPPPAFPKLPKSALLSKLQSFLPVMEQENKKLEEALAAGDGAKHSIEVDEDEAAQAAEDGGADKPPVIEMNFALGMMEDENKVDANDSSDDDDDGGDVDLKKSILTAASGGQLSIQNGDDKEAAAFDLKLSRTSNKPRPVIQELN